MSGARQKHVGHIGAGNQQDTTNGAEKREEQRLHEIQAGNLHDGPDVRGDVLVGVGVLRDEASSQGSYFRTGRGEGASVAEIAKQHKVAVVSFFAGRVGNQWRPQIRFFRKATAGRHHANHHARNFIHANRFADDGRIAGVAVAPDVITEYKYGRSAGAFVFGNEIAPQQRLVPDY